MAACHPAACAMGSASPEAMAAKALSTAE